MEEYRLAEIERGIKRAEAKAKLAGAKARKSEAEAEVWKARRANWGNTVSARGYPSFKKKSDEEEAMR